MVVHAHSVFANVYVFSMSRQLYLYDVCILQRAHLGHFENAIYRGRVRSQTQIACTFPIWIYYLHYYADWVGEWINYDTQQVHWAYHVNVNTWTVCLFFFPMKFAVLAFCMRVMLQRDYKINIRFSEDWTDAQSFTTEHWKIYFCWATDTDTENG